MRSALAATAERFHDEGWASAHMLANETLDRISIQYPALVPYFGTGIGLRLQYLDAKICTRIQRHFRNLKVPCLSIHDSFIVPNVAAAELNTTMKREMRAELSRIRPPRRSEWVISVR